MCFRFDWCHHQTIILLVNVAWCGLNGQVNLEFQTFIRRWSVLIQFFLCERETVCIYPLLEGREFCCFCLLPLTVSFCSLPGRKVAPSTLSNSCSCSSSCPLIHMLPAFPVIQVCLKYPLPQEAFLACPFLNWSHVSSSRWLGIHCLSWVTGRAHLISLWERESCMIHLCALKGHMQW